MFLFRLAFALLWILMTVLVILIATGVGVYGLDPVALIVFAPFMTLAILTFWVKDI